MIKLVILACLISASLAADSKRQAQYYKPVPTYTPGQQIPIVRLDSDISPDGSYHWAYETANGISAEESGQLRGTGDAAGTVAQGGYQYTSPEGVPVQISYIADENGFQPTGNVLPTPPPIPPAIARALEFIAAHPEPQQQVYNQQQYYPTTPQPYRRF